MSVSGKVSSYDSLGDEADRVFYANDATFRNKTRVCMYVWDTCVQEMSGCVICAEMYTHNAMCVYSFFSATSYLIIIKFSFLLKKLYDN